MDQDWTLIWQLTDSFGDTPFSISHYLDLKNLRIKEVTDVVGVITEREITCLITLAEIMNRHKNEIAEIYQVKLLEIEGNLTKECGECRYYKESIKPGNKGISPETIADWISKF